VPIDFHGNQHVFRSVTRFSKNITKQKQNKTKTKITPLLSHRAYRAMLGNSGFMLSLTPLSATYARESRDSSYRTSMLSPPIEDSYITAISSGAC